MMEVMLGKYSVQGVLSTDGGRARRFDLSTQSAHLFGGWQDVGLEGE
jgi:hypothetical protein